MITPVASVMYSETALNPKHMLLLLFLYKPFNFWQSTKDAGLSNVSGTNFSAPLQQT